MGRMIWGTLVEESIAVIIVLVVVIIIVVIVIAIFVILFCSRTKRPRLKSIATTVRGVILRSVLSCSQSPAALLLRRLAAQAAIVPSVLPA